MRRPSTTAEIYRWHLAALRGERPARFWMIKASSWRAFLERFGVTQE